VPVLSRGRRVRVFTVDHDMHLAEPELVDIFQHIALYQPGLRIFPRLQHLYWTLSSPKALPYIYMFLQFNLTILEFHYHSGQEPIGHELENAFRLISYECRDLRNLKLCRKNEPGPSMAGEAIGTALSGISHLRVFRLDADMLSAGGFGHLARMASLREVDIMWPSIETSQRAALAQVCEHDRPFPALEILELHLELSDVEPSERNNPMVPELLGAVAGPLVELVIKTYSFARPVVEMLGTQLFHVRDTLREFSLDCGPDTAQQADDQVAKFRLDMHALRPLCALRHLVHVQIVTPHLDVDSSGLRELIQAWPLLEHFEFCPPCVRYVPVPLDAQEACPPFGIDDLTYIAERCPRLEHLELPLHINTVALDAHIPSTHPQRRLKFLSLFSSVMPDGRAACFVSFLYATFPALSHVSFPIPVLRGPAFTAAQMEAYHDAQTAQVAAFEEVSRLMREAAAVREKERKFWRNEPL
jgi:hypothetical protein